MNTDMIKVWNIYRALSTVNEKQGVLHTEFVYKSCLLISVTYIDIQK